MIPFDECQLLMRDDARTTPLRLNYTSYLRGRVQNKSHINGPQCSDTRIIAHQAARWPR
jgi:hypothetical protein